MFQSLNILGHQHRSSAPLAADELSVSLSFLAGSQGKMIPVSIVVLELLWQHYGLDLLHPAVNRWLEQNAPDVKYAIAATRFANGTDHTQTHFKVGPDGKIKLRLSLKVDDRLRSVVSQYLLNQIQPTLEPQAEFLQAS